MPIVTNVIQLVRDLICQVSDADQLPEPIHRIADKLGISPTSLFIASLSTAFITTGAIVYSRSSTHHKNSTSNIKKAPPHVKHWIPFLGSMVSFGINPIKFLQYHQSQLGDVFTFTMFGREMTFALGPDGNNLVFNAKLSHTSAEDAYNSLTKPVFGEGVVYDTTNHRFMDQKKYGKTGMSNDNLRAYVGMIEEETRNYFSRWSNMSGTEELFKAMAELTIMTASRCLMGPEIRSHLDETVAKLYHDLDQGFQPINFLFESLPLPSYWRRDQAHTKMRNLFISIMKQRREQQQKNNTDNTITKEYTDVLHTFMTAKYRSGESFTDNDVAHMMIALLMAGQHTSSTTSTWILCYLADHPEIWSQLEIELMRELQGDLINGELTYDVLKRCELLDAVIRETLRLRPPITSIMRKVIHPITYNGYEIPKGHYLCAAPVVSQLDSQGFDQPLQWKPSRWLMNKNDNNNDNNSNDMYDYGFGLVSSSARSYYLPFGAGRHRCIGEQFAYVQLKTIIATMIKQFSSIRFISPQKFPDCDFTSMIVMPVRPIRISYTRRVSSTQTRPRTDSAQLDKNIHCHSDEL